MSKISIALCTYNGAEFLGEQLESYLAQTRPPDELIVGDDNSGDGTVQILEDFARRAPFPVELKINERNLGSTENFARTIARCRGDIIFLSDQDDVWLPRKIERLTKEFAAPIVGLVFSDAELVGENLAPLGANLCDFTFAPEARLVAERTSFFESLLPRNYITGATLAFRSEFRSLFAPFPSDIPDMIHDGWIALVIAANADVRFVDEVLIKYRQHARQQLGIVVEKESADLNRRARYERDLEISRAAKTRIEKILREIAARPSAFAGKDLIEAARREMRKQERRIVHHEARKNLPRARLKRIAPVAGELFGGRYHEISKGFLSAAKDLLDDI